ncbi:hypothetical protein MTBBW1_1540001 [Desulfamplus magnetovallimortis]|uniref:Uncharacterized protein n=1 Tax=Desulfamplus magnetovallimortis TaxID=1246637 RepID=A0A1W1H8Q5_9BACT|nr:hypothetical protein [Desulfamplus magnetovallimortis]SLM28775.1 hypothetical protein MTBBW1_1540001 [Desulfamplus magnetovallimortis]
MDYQNKTIEIEIGADTVIELPDNIHRKEIQCKKLIIAEDQANWVVLFNKKQKKYLI